MQGLFLMMALFAPLCCLMWYSLYGVLSFDNLYTYLVDTPLSFGTFNSYPEVISLLIPLAFKRDKRVLPHFNLLGVIVGGILLSSIGFYFPLSYFNLFNE
jgi:hypothetical protein